MSRPRARSPHHRRFPSEEPDFNPRKVVKELGGNPRNRSHHFREGPEEHGNFFREEMYLESHGRSLPPDDPPFGHQRHPDQKFHHRNLSPHHDGRDYEDWSFSSVDDGGFDNYRHRGGFTPRGSGTNLRKERDRGQGRGRFRDFSPSRMSGDQRVGAVEREWRNTQDSYRGRRESPRHERRPPSAAPRREPEDVGRLG